MTHQPGPTLADKEGKARIAWLKESIRNNRAMIRILLDQQFCMIGEVWQIRAGMLVEWVRRTT